MKAYYLKHENNEKKKENEILDNGINCVLGVDLIAFFITLLVLFGFLPSAPHYHYSDYQPPIIIPPYDPIVKRSVNESSTTTMEKITPVLYVFAVEVVIFLIALLIKHFTKYSPELKDELKKSVKKEKENLTKTLLEYSVFSEKNDKDFIAFFKEHVHDKKPPIKEKTEETVIDLESAKVQKNGM